MSRPGKVWIRGDFVLMALCLLVAVSWRVPVFSGRPVPLRGDEIEYHGLALRLSNGHALADAAGVSTAWRTPGLLLILATIYRVAGEDYSLARVVLGTITGLIAPALYSLCLLLFVQRSIALLAGLNWVVLPTSRRLAGALLGDPVSAFC